MNIIKRNAPIFIIGFVTVLIFVGIIIASQGKSSSPSLKPVSEDLLITDHTYIKGPKDSPVTLVEFGDFECPACQTFHPIVNYILENHANELKFAYRHFPLPQHKYAKKAAEASQIAGESGKFWEYYDLMYKQQALSEEDLIKYAKALGLDTDKFMSDLRNGTFASIVSSDVKDGNKLGINSTPTFYLNGKKMVLQTTKDLIDQVEAEILRLEPPKTTESTSSGTDGNKNGTTNTTEKPNVSNKVLEITYTKGGFSPKEPDADSGQLVRWKNTTDKEIILVETLQKFPEFELGVKIAPNGVYEFRITKDKLWTYKELETGNFGSIFIITN